MLYIAIGVALWFAFAKYFFCALSYICPPVLMVLICAVYKLFNSKVTYRMKFEA